MYSNLNGSICLPKDARVSVLDRGVLLGDGLFETICVRNSKALFMPEHWIRLNQSARKIDFKLPLNEKTFVKIIDELIQLNNLNHAGLRLTLTRGVGERGLLPKFVRDSMYYLHSFDLPSVPASLKLCVSSIRRNETSPSSGLKTLSYFDNMMVKREAVGMGYDDGLCLNTQGIVTDTSCANFFLIKDRSILTSPLEGTGVLPGILRAQISLYCQQRRIPFIEIPLKIEDIKEKTSAFITNTLLGVVPVTQVGDIQLNMHRTLEMLSKHFYS
jgi:branched-chain amino acid aminotransferase